MPAYSVARSQSGPSSVIPINLKRFKFGVGLIVTFGTGATGTVNVEVTGDALNNGPGSSNSGNPTNWNLHDVLNALTASKNSSLAYPCTAIRLNPVNLSGGTVTLTVVEAEG